MEIFRALCDEKIRIATVFPERSTKRVLGLPRACHRAAIDGDEKRFRDEYRIPRDYSASLVDGMKRMGALSLRTPDDEQFEMPTDMVFMNRVQFGLYSVLARLDVAVDYAQIERGIWPEVERAMAKS